MIHIVDDPNVWGSGRALAICGSEAAFTDDGDMPEGFDFVEPPFANRADCPMCRRQAQLTGEPEADPIMATAAALGRAFRADLVELVRKCGVEDPEAFLAARPAKVYIGTDAGLGPPVAAAFVNISPTEGEPACPICSKPPAEHDGETWEDHVDQAIAREVSNDPGPPVPYEPMGPGALEVVACPALPPDTWLLADPAALTAEIWKGGGTYSNRLSEKALAPPCLESSLAALKRFAAATDPVGVCISAPAEEQVVITAFSPKTDQFLRLGPHPKPFADELRQLLELDGLTDIVVRPATAEDQRDPLADAEALMRVARKRLKP